MKSPHEPYILGIDLGSNSIGWVLLDTEKKNAEPCGIRHMGARVFEAGMDGDIESGREESRNKARREARMHRRMLWRRARRKGKVFHLLQRAGFMPAGLAGPLSAAVGAEEESEDEGCPVGTTLFRAAKKCVPKRKFPPCNSLALQQFAMAGTTGLEPN